MKKLATRQELTDALKFVLEAGPYSAIGRARRVLGLRETIETKVEKALARIKEALKESEDGREI